LEQPFRTFIFNPRRKEYVRENEKKQNAHLELSLKRGLATSGYSEEIADKIWKWYNPPELNGNKPKK